MAEDSNNQETPQRYAMQGTKTVDKSNYIALEDDHGEWVKWEDVEKLLKIIKNQREALQRVHAPKK